MKAAAKPKASPKDPKIVPQGQKNILNFFQKSAGGPAAGVSPQKLADLTPARASDSAATSPDSVAHQPLSPTTPKENIVKRALSMDSPRDGDRPPAPPSRSTSSASALPAGTPESRGSQTDPNDVPRAAPPPAVPALARTVSAGHHPLSSPTRGTPGPDTSMTLTPSLPATHVLISPLHLLSPSQQSVASTPGTVRADNLEMTEAEPLTPARSVSPHHAQLSRSTSAAPRTLIPPSPQRAPTPQRAASPPRTSTPLRRAPSHVPPPTSSAAEVPMEVTSTSTAPPPAVSPVRAPEPPTPSRKRARSPDNEAEEPSSKRLPPAEDVPAASTTTDQQPTTTTASEVPKVPSPHESLSSPEEAPVSLVGIKTAEEDEAELDDFFSGPSLYKPAAPTPAPPPPASTDVEMEDAPQQDAGDLGLHLNTSAESERTATTEANESTPEKNTSHDSLEGEVAFPTPRAPTSTVKHFEHVKHGVRPPRQLRSETVPATPKAPPPAPMVTPLRQVRDPNMDFLNMLATEKKREQAKENARRKRLEAESDTDDDEEGNRAKDIIHDTELLQQNDFAVNVPDVPCFAERPAPLEVRLPDMFKAPRNTSAVELDERRNNIVVALTAMGRHISDANVWQWLFNCVAHSANANLARNSYGLLARLLGLPYTNCASAFAATVYHQENPVIPPDATAHPPLWCPSGDDLMEALGLTPEVAIVEKAIDLHPPAPGYPDATHGARARNTMLLVQLIADMAGNGLLEQNDCINLAMALFRLHFEPQMRDHTFALTNALTPLLTVVGDMVQLLAMRVDEHFACADPRVQLAVAGACPPSDRGVELQRLLATLFLLRLVNRNVADAKAADEKVPGTDVDVGGIASLGELRRLIERVTLCQPERSSRVSKLDKNSRGMSWVGLYVIANLVPFAVGTRDEVSRPDAGEDLPDLASTLRKLGGEVHEVGHAYLDRSTVKGVFLEMTSVLMALKRAPVKKQQSLSRSFAATPKVQQERQTPPQVVTQTKVDEEDVEEEEEEEEEAVPEPMQTDGHTGDELDTERVANSSCDIV